jgi:hypothetical protein
MTLIPYKKQILLTKFTEEQIKHILQKNIAPLPKLPYKILYNIPSEQLKYTGWLFEKGFKIFPQVNHRNSFIPFIIGKLNGSKITITFRLHYFIAIFSAIWFMIWGIAIFFILIQNLSVILKLLFPGTFVLFYFLSIINFNNELKRSMDFLNNLFIQS